MHFKYLPAIISFATLVFFTGCHSDVDLENIDKRAEMELGLALPLGALHATIGDFLGNGEITDLSVDSAGIFHYITTIDLPVKQYHTVDLTSYLLENDKAFSLYIKEKLGGISTIYGDGSTEIEMSFPMSLSTAHFNTDESNERIDSILVTSAEFVSKINVEDFGLKWSEIKKVELELDPTQCRRPKGNRVEVPIDGYKFKDEIPIIVKDFTMILMDEKNGGTVPKINYNIYFTVCPDNGHNIDLTDDSKFTYDLKVQVINYDAIWGFFQASKNMKDKDRLDIDSLWSDWKNMKKLKVRFMEPAIDMKVYHRVAAPLRLNMDYLIAIDSTGKSTNATWNGATSTSFILEHSLSPYRPLTDSVDNTFHFSYKPDEGHLDELFEVRPDFFEYSYYLEVDKNSRPDYKWPQHRITKDVRVTGTTTFDVPFKMNKGSEIEYTSLKNDVAISRFSLDSIVQSVDVLESIEAADIKLIIVVENGIPFNMDAYLTFLDKNGNDLKLKLIEENKENHLHFPAPKMARAASEVYGHVVEPSKSRYVFSIGKNEFDRMSEVASMQMHVAMTDNPEPCMLTKETDLNIKMGLSAHVNATLNFENANNTTTNK